MPHSLDFGVDVARFGDDSSVGVGCRGNEAWIAFRVRGFDGNRVADEIVSAVGERRIGLERVCIRIDEIGCGAAVIDALRERKERSELDAGIRIFGVNVARSADNEDEYHSLRDQLWFGMNEWIKTGKLPNDAALKTELTSVQYLFDARGRRQVEAKERMKKRIGRSPDTADALALAVYRRNDDVSPVSYSPGEGWAR